MPITNSLVSHITAGLGKFYGAMKIANIIALGK